MRWQHNKGGPYQDILTKWVKFQDNCWLQDNFRTTVKFQEFQDNWEPCILSFTTYSSVIIVQAPKVWTLNITRTEHPKYLTSFSIRKHSGKNVLLLWKQICLPVLCLCIGKIFSVYINQDSHSFTDKNPGVFQDPMNNFPGLFGAPECLNIKKKTAFPYNIQSVVHWQNSSTFHTVLK